MPTAVPAVLRHPTLHKVRRRIPPTSYFPSIRLRAGRGGPAGSGRNELERQVEIMLCRKPSERLAAMDTAGRHWIARSNVGYPSTAAGVSVHIGQQPDLRIMVAQRMVDTTANEIMLAPAVADQLDLTEMVMSSDTISARRCLSTRVVK